MQESFSVLKFDGLAGEGVAALKNIVQILTNYREKHVLVVVSAIGDTTAALEKVAEAHRRQDGQAVLLLEEIKRFHYNLLTELLGENESVFASINDVFVEIDWVLEDEPHEDAGYDYDQIVSVGEVVASKVVAAYLEHSGLPTQWLDARDIILTDNSYRSGRVDWTETMERNNRITKPLLQEPGLVVTPGFIGSTTENFTTTLGPRGADYSAAIFASCLNVNEMTIWSPLTELDPEQMHPSVLESIQNKGLTVLFKSYLKPESAAKVLAVS